MNAPVDVHQLHPSGRLYITLSVPIVDSATALRHPTAMDDRIVIDPAIAHGKPIIRGTRVAVAIVVGALAGGMTFEDLQREYDLTAADIRAALKFAGDLVQQESFHPLSAG